MALIPVHVIVTYGLDGDPSSSHVMVGDRARDADTQFRRCRAVANLSKVTLWSGSVRGDTPENMAADLAALRRAVAATFGVGLPNWREALKSNLVRAREYTCLPPVVVAAAGMPTANDPYSAYGR